MPDEEIHLTVPADADMGSVVVAALGALARAVGLGGDAVTEVREHAAAAYLRAIEHGGRGDVEVTASGHGRAIRFEVRRDDWTEAGHHPPGNP